MLDPQTAHLASSGAQHGNATNIEDSLDDPDVKVILLGDSAVGKSKLVERFMMNEFQPRQLSTFALTLYRKEVELDGDNGKRTVKVDFWDTAGQERFSSMHPSYYYGATACILVFDVTRKVTYQNLANWYKELREYCEKIPCFLVANKIDVDMNVTSKKFKFAETHNLEFSFVSAADGTNVVKVFKDAVEAACKFKEEGGDFMSDVLDLLGEEPMLIQTTTVTKTKDSAKMAMSHEDLEKQVPKDAEDANKSGEESAGADDEQEDSVEETEEDAAQEENDGEDDGGKEQEEEVGLSYLYTNFEDDDNDDEDFEVDAAARDDDDDEEEEEEEEEEEDTGATAGDEDDSAAEDDEDGGDDDDADETAEDDDADEVEDPEEQAEDEDAPKAKKQKLTADEK